MCGTFEIESRSRIAGFAFHKPTLGVAAGLFFCVCAASAQTRPMLQATPAAPQSGQSAAAQAPVVGSLLPSAAVAANYIIGPNDVLQITVWKEPNVSQSGVPVRPDGKISVPLIGDVIAAGMTPTVLATHIAESLRHYMQEPQVTVGVVSVYPKEIFVVGEVGHAGPVTLVPGMTLLQAIAAAGGLAPFAKKKLYILRMGSAPGAAQQKIPFDYKKAFRDGDQQGITIMPGDTIVVP